MARRQKISQMTPKGANLQGTDLLEISEVSGTGYITKSITGQQIINAASGGGGGSGTVTSVDLTMPSAFTVTGNPITTAGTLAVAGAGVATQYIRGDGQLANFPTDIQSIPIVVNANITAENNKVYHVIANATFTDPTGVEGKGYVVFVINGTATIGGSGISTAYTIVYRLFFSGAWQTRSYIHSGTIASIYVPQSRTINGLDLSANRTLTTADIADSSNKRYVTDANLTVIGNTSGTNTGDQDLTNLVVKNTAITGATKTKITYDAKGLVTAGADATTADIADSTNKRYVTDAQLTVLGNTSNTNSGDETESSILSKLGWWTVHETTAGTASSGTALTITKSIALPSVPNFLNFRAVFFKTNSNGAYTVRAYLSEVDNNIGGTAIQIAVVTGTNVAVNNLPIKRTFDIIGGNVIGLNSSASQATDDVNVSNARLNLAIPTGTPLYLIFAVQCTSVLDTARFESCQINNFTF